MYEQFDLILQFVPKKYSQWFSTRLLAVAK